VDRFYNSFAFFLTLGLSTCDMVTKRKRGIAIHHGRNKKGTEGEMCPVVFRTTDHYWVCAAQPLAIISLSLLTVPEVFAKFNSTQFPSHFLKVMLHTRRFATMTFSATQCCDIVSTLFQMIPTWFQHYNAVLR